MKLFRPIISIVCVVGAFIANAAEQTTAKAKGAADQPSSAEVLQGRWEGVMVGDPARQKIIITIAGNSLHFHRDTSFWFETTIILPEGTEPKELHATIKGCPPGQESSVGKVVVAIYKIEEGKLSLVALGEDEEERPKSFEAAEEKGLARYELRKVQKKNTEPGTSK